MVYKCDTCEKEFTSKTDFTRHISRKFKCVSKKYVNKTVENIKTNETNETNENNEINEIKEIKSEYECIYCCKFFTRKYNLDIHIKKSCKHKGMYILKKELDELKIKMEKLESREKKEGNITVNSNNNINNNNNNNVIVFNFNSAYLPSIFTDKELLNILDNQIANIVPSMVEQLHFCPERPEYHNVYSPDRKSDVAFIYNGKTYISTFLDDVVSKLDSRMKEYLNKFVLGLEENKDIILSEKEYKSLNDRFERLNDLDEKDYVQIRSNKKLKFLLYDNRDMIKKSIKKSIKHN